MRAPLANRQSGYSYRNGYIWAPPARRDIYREEDMGPLQRSGATYCKGNESGPAPKAGTLREDMGRSPTGRAGTVIGMGIYGPRLQGGTYIGKKIWALANSERHIRNGDGMGLDGSRNQSGTAYGPPPPRGGAMRELRGAEPHITESGKHLYSQPKRKRKRKLITIYR